MFYRSILLIDDDAEDQEIFKEAIDTVSGECVCTCFTNPRTALDKLLQKEVTPNVIFLDLNMPIMSGMEFLAEMKKHTGISNLPVIIFSTTANPSTIKQVKDLGAIDFITKPDRFDALVNILRPIIVDK